MTLKVRPRLGRSLGDASGLFTDAPLRDDHPTVAVIDTARCNFGCFEHGQEIVGFKIEQFIKPIFELSTCEL